jgi:thiamine kinase-like enzyme
LKLDALLLKNDTDLSHFIMSVCDEDEMIVFVRFHTLSEKSRCYCFYNDSLNNLCFFSKISFDEKNKKLLKHEANTLKALGAMEQGFLLPKLLKEYYGAEYYALLTSSIPPEFHVCEKESMFLDNNLAQSIQGTLKVYPSSLDELTWFRKVRDENSYNSLFDIIKDSSGVIKFSRVHGDLGSENILTSGTDKINESSFLVDWERFSPNAPYLVDCLAYWLGYHHKDILSGIFDAKRMFFDQFVCEYDNDIINSMSALIYLVYVDFDLSVSMAKSLEKEL